MIISGLNKKINKKIMQFNKKEKKVWPVSPQNAVGINSSSTMKCWKRTFPDFPKRKGKKRKKKNPNLFHYIKKRKLKIFHCVVYLALFSLHTLDYLQPYAN